MGVQVQILRRLEAAYSAKLLATRYHTWAVHPMIYKMMDACIPFCWALRISRDKYSWNTIEIDYRYPHPSLELRRGGADEEAFVVLIRGQTFWVPTSGGEMVAGISLNPGSSVWDGRGPDLSSFSISRQSNAVVALISGSAPASILLTAADRSVRAMPDGDVPVVAEWNVKPTLIPEAAAVDFVDKLIAVLESATGITPAVASPKMGPVPDNKVVEMMPEKSCLEGDGMCCNQGGQTYWADDSEIVAGVLRTIKAAKAIRAVQQKVYDIAERRQQRRSATDNDAEPQA
jgi:hypothetical protein